MAVFAKCKKKPRFRRGLADDEPYVHRYELDKATALLKELGAQIPDLLPYDPATYEKFPWKDKVVAAIDKLRAENEAEKASEAEE